MAGIYYAIVDGDPLTSGPNSHVYAVGASDFIDDESGRRRNMAFIGDKAYCEKCKSTGIIIGSAGVDNDQRMIDLEDGGRRHAVGGDYVRCKCPEHPQVRCGRWDAKVKCTAISLLLAGLTVGRAFASEALFENRTEDSTSGWTHVTHASASSLIRREAQTQDPSGYAQAGEIPKDPGTRLVWKAVPISLKGQDIRFVRPTLAPYFAPFYGAHQFQHWLISNSRILHEGSSDLFQVLRAEHRGMRDIAETAYTAITCYTTHFRFNQRSGRYEAASCRASTISSGADAGPCRHGSE
jgi:hypothetical protein